MTTTKKIEKETQERLDDLQDNKLNGRLSEGQLLECNSSMATSQIILSGEMKKLNLLLEKMIKMRQMELVNKR